MHFVLKIVCFLSKAECLVGHLIRYGLSSIHRFFFGFIQHVFRLAGYLMKGVTYFFLQFLGF